MSVLGAYCLAWMWVGCWLCVHLHLGFLNYVESQVSSLRMQSRLKSHRYSGVRLQTGPWSVVLRLIEA